MRTVHDVIPAFIAAVLLLAGLTPRAGAQVEPIEPVWMVATREAPLRCGELSTFYKVADLKRGQVVRVDGRSTRWARVIYPASLYGFVREEHARDVEGGSLRVGDISDIKAPNQISGLSGSWRSIFLGELQPGTRLEIVGEALSKDGADDRLPRPPAGPARGRSPPARLRSARDAPGRHARRDRRPSRGPAPPGDRRRCRNGRRRERDPRRRRRGRNGRHHVRREPGAAEADPPIPPAPKPA
jgi:hypothetical protein